VEEHDPSRHRRGVGRRRGRIIVVSGPSGVGKGAVVARLLELLPDLHLSVSTTTRPARPGEVDGVHYRFVTPEAFQALIDKGELLEWADVFGRRYGTPRDAVERELAAGVDVVLEVNVDGARQVRAGTGEAHLVFLRPPSLEELERRLRQRGTESEDQIRRRLATAGQELVVERAFDDSIVNDDLEAAATELAGVIRRLRGQAPG
jgi:guanylate kinase